MPLAPALLSTTTACLVCSVIDWPSARASWSVALPAANGTTKVIGLAGYACPNEGAAGASATAARAAATTTRRGRRTDRNGDASLMVVFRVSKWKEKAAFTARSARHRDRGPR